VSEKLVYVFFNKGDANMRQYFSVVCMICLGVFLFSGCASVPTPSLLHTSETWETQQANIQNAALFNDSYVFWRSKDLKAVETHYGKSMQSGQDYMKLVSDSLAQQGMNVSNTFFSIAATENPNVIVQVVEAPDGGEIASLEPPLLIPDAMADDPNARKTLSTIFRRLVSAGQPPKGETFNLDTLALTQEELDVLNTYTEADTYVFASEFILAKRGNEMGRTIGKAAATSVLTLGMLSWTKQYFFPSTLRVLYVDAKTGTPLRYMQQTYPHKEMETEENRKKMVEDCFTYPQKKSGGSSAKTRKKR